MNASRMRLTVLFASAIGMMGLTLAPSKEFLNKSVQFMIRSFDTLMTHHEWNQQFNARPEFVEELNQKPSKPVLDPSTLRTEELLDHIMASSHRELGNRQRDIFRHPKETLLFFGITENMTVVEVWPYGGWYTEILAPLLRNRGKLYAASFALGSKQIAPYQKHLHEQFIQKLNEAPAFYDRVVVTALDAPEFSAIAPKASADLVLTFQNIHNWVSRNNATETFQAMYEALKPGGVLGIVEHRGHAGSPGQQEIKNGYVSEDHVVALAREAGFTLVGNSEINANPKDSKNHPNGVWTLPPTLALGEKDRAKYLEIGESDKMTLKFVKE